ncbi:sodium ion-translocating decarboxylase subunit beta [Enterococcus mediterraneensis]|uniref:sodium ion-translocating decarboxylase subunit beta n=1 Tax=Enterococcus mediterraneensis TaxID=2364791 RepID=UPI000F066C77|nr:sodium ion-translocating decarboxylase subunit beta [Enterococcus mediterraneensis]
MTEIIQEMIVSSGIAGLTWKHAVMIIIALIFIYLAVFKKYEPYLLLPISFGILLVNLPLTGIFAPPTSMEPGGLLYYLYQGTALGIYPPLIFLCLGAATDFGPLIANPKTLLLGAAAQFGIFAAFFGAILLGMTGPEAAATGIIGGADGPTAIYLTTRLAPELLPVIAIAAYSYMALVPIIQPPIINALTTKEERKIKMHMQRSVKRKEKIIFPIFTTIFVALIVPAATTLIGSLMLGNLIRESQVVPKLTATLQDSLMFILTILLGLTVGAKAEAEIFLSLATIKIILLGLFAFAVGTAAGVLFGKLMCRLTKGAVNPMIGAAGVSAVPMAARVVHQEGLKNNSSNYLLMHAMGPNVAGIIGSAVAAGVLLAFFG